MVEIHNFLPASAAESILSHVLGRKDDFSLVTGAGQRHTYLLHNTGQKEPQYAGPVIERVHQLVQGVAEPLAMAFCRPSVTWATIAYHNGSFFAAHKDNVFGNHASKLSFIYYLHRMPRGFEGGDLVLYGSKSGPNGRRHRKPPEHNSIIFFPSATFHEVTPVTCKSSCFADGRFAISGWISDDASNAGRHEQARFGGVVRTCVSRFTQTCATRE